MTIWAGEGAAGEKATSDRDVVIANISAPSSLRSSDSDDEGEGEAAEGEEVAAEE